MLDDDRLRRLYALGASDSEPHLDADGWERLAGGEMESDDRQRALEHLTGCPECAPIYRGLSMLAEDAGAFDPGVPVDALVARSCAVSTPRTRRRPAPRLLWGALAAAAALVLFVALPTNFPGDSIDTVEQTESVSPATDRLRATSQRRRPQPDVPVGTIMVPPVAFSWQGTPAAGAYRIELLSADAELLWSSEAIEETSSPWPDQVVAEPGRYYWRVLALPQAGGEPAASELVAFDLETAGPTSQ